MALRCPGEVLAGHQGEFLDENWHRLLRAEESPSLAMFKERLDIALTAMV